MSLYGLVAVLCEYLSLKDAPDGKVHGGNMGPTWGRINLALRGIATKEQHWHHCTNYCLMSRFVIQNYANFVQDALCVVFIRYVINVGPVCISG